MADMLLIYRNELSNKQVYGYKLMGILTDMALSNEIFPTNDDLRQFLGGLSEETAGLFAKTKTRPQMVGQACSLLVKAADTRPYSKKLLSFVREKIAEAEKTAKEAAALPAKAKTSKAPKTPKAKAKRATKKKAE